MIDLTLLRRFVPTHTIGPNDRAELAKYCQLRHFLAGEQVFRAGGLSPQVLFLVEGEIEVRSATETLRIQAGSERARYAVSNGATFSSAASCLSDAQVLYIDREQLDRILTWSQAGTIEVRDLNDEEQSDWMAAILASPVLQQVPPANIVRVIASVEQVDFADGEAIVKYGAAGDYYYVLVAGECRIMRPCSVGGEPEEVDRVRPGGGFGEEALVSGMSRNATVEAIGNCRLVRLPGRDFHRFLREPLVQSVGLNEVSSESQCIDVRLPEEYSGGHLPGARNLPLRDLRRRCAEIDGDRPAIVYCDGGGRSASATFLLRERGFDARWLEGGVPNSHLTER